MIDMDDRDENLVEEFISDVKEGTKEFVDDVMDAFK